MSVWLRGPGQSLRLWWPRPTAPDWPEAHLPGRLEEVPNTWSTEGPTMLRTLETGKVGLEGDWFWGDLSFLSLHSGPHLPTLSVSKLCPGLS